MKDAAKMSDAELKLLYDNLTQEQKVDIYLLLNEQTSDSYFMGDIATAVRLWLATEEGKNYVATLK